MSDYISCQHPLHIPLVLGLVLKHSVSSTLISLRAVNHFWNELATRQLRANGWSLSLKTGERICEYLSLVRAAQETGAIHISMNLHICTIVSTYGSTDNCAAVTSAAELQEYVSTANSSCGIRSITFHLCPTGIDSNLRHLLQLVSTTLTHITFVLLNRDFFSEVEPSPSTRLKRPEELIAREGGLNLPQLKTLCLDSSTTSGEEVAPTFGHTQIEALMTIVAIAPNLKHIRCCPGLLAQNRSPFILFPFGHMEFYRVRLQRLTELEVLFREMWYMQRMPEAQFLNLRVLKISLQDTFQGTLPRLFSISRHYQLALTQLIKDKCPVLESWETTELKNLRQLGSVQLVDHDDERRLLLRLPHLTHLGYKLMELPETGWVTNEAIAATLCMADTMNRFSNLTRVTTNLESCTKLGNVYRSTDEYVLPNPDPNDGVQLHSSIRRPQLDRVTLLTIDVSHSSVPLPSAPFAASRLRDVIALLKAIYLNLDELIINLGADRVAWKVTSNFGYILDLVFGLDTISRAEINNYYNGWTLTEEPPSTPTLNDLSHNEPEVNSNLEMLTINGIRSSFGKSHVDTTAFCPPCLDLARICEYIPIEIRPRVLLAIDGDLLMNSGLHKSYIELQNEVSPMTNPRIRLM